MAQRFRPLPGSAMAVRPRFFPALLPGASSPARGWGRILRFRLFVADLAVFLVLVTAKEIRVALVVRIFAADSFPETVRPSSAPVGLCRCRIGLVTVAVGLSAVADPDLAVVVAVGFVAGFDSACLVCPSSVATGMGKVVAAAAFCFSVPRSSSLRTRSFLLPL